MPRPETASARVARPSRLRCVSSTSRLSLKHLSRMLAKALCLILPILRACAKLTCRNARSGSDQCSIPNAQFLSEQREAARVRAVLIEAEAIGQSACKANYPGCEFNKSFFELRIEHWELNRGQILGLMPSSGYCQVIFA